MLTNSAPAHVQLVELKAELFRRKAEYDREKTDPAERAALKAKAKVYTIWAVVAHDGENSPIHARTTEANGLEAKSRGRSEVSARCSAASRRGMKTHH